MLSRSSALPMLGYKKKQVNIKKYQSKPELIIRVIFKIQ
jgi:hypothetical protein